MKRTQADKWALNMEAARQFHAREGHLNVPRKHLEQMDGDEAGVKLGMFVDNARRRADKLTAERHEALSALGHALGVGSKGPAGENPAGPFVALSS